METGCFALGGAGRGDGAHTAAANERPPPLSPVRTPRSWTGFKYSLLCHGTDRTVFFLNSSESIMKISESESHLNATDSNLTCGTDTVQTINTNYNI